MLLIVYLCQMKMMILIVYMCQMKMIMCTGITRGRRQSKMAIENPVSNNFLSMFVDSINIFDCHLPSVHGYTAFNKHLSGVFIDFVVSLVNGFIVIVRYRCFYQCS